MHAWCARVWRVHLWWCHLQAAFREGGLGGRDCGRGADGWREGGLFGCIRCGIVCFGFGQLMVCAMVRRWYWWWLLHIR